MEDLNTAEQPVDDEDIEQPEADSGESFDGGEDEQEPGEQPEGDSDQDDEQPEPDSAEFLTYQDSEGKEVRVSKADALEAHKRAGDLMADYTRKTQNLARERQHAVEQSQQEMQFVQMHQAELGQLSALGMQLRNAEQAGEFIDPQVLRAFHETQARVNQQRAAFAQHQQQRLDQNHAETWQHMKAVDTDFNAQSLRQMFDYMGRYGYAVEELNMTGDKRQVHAMYDLWKKAKAFDALQAKANPKAKQTKQPVPVVTKVTAKAGAARKDTSRMSDAEYVAFLDRRKRKP